MTAGVPISYENRRFVGVANTTNGDVSARTVFHYRQTGNIVTADYAGGAIVSGHLVALASADGRLDMRYHHVNANGELMTGVGTSVPEVLPDGRLRLHETWRWTCADSSEGTSVVEEG